MDYRASFISFIIFSLYLLSSCTSPCERVQDFKKTPYKGRIVSKEIEKWNRSAKVLEIENLADERRYIYLTYDKSDLWNKAQLGDSLVKSKNSFRVRLIKNSSTSELLFLVGLGCK